MPGVVVNISATGDQVLVAAPPTGQFIRVLGGELSAVAAQSLVSLKGGSTEIWRTVALNAANSSITINVNKDRTIDCPQGTALNINNAASGNVSGFIEYTIYGKPPS